MSWVDAPLRCTLRCRSIARSSMLSAIAHIICLTPHRQPEGMVELVITRCIIILVVKLFEHKIAAERQDSYSFMPCATAGH